MGPGLCLMDKGRLTPQPGYGRARTNEGHGRRLTFYGVYQESLVAAGEFAVRLFDLYAEADVGIQDMIPQKPVILRLLQSGLSLPMASPSSALTRT